MKKIISFIMAVVMTMSICATSAFAAEPKQANTYLDENGVIIIVADSDEEYNNIINDIEEQNDRVEQLWQAALQESKLPENNKNIVPLRNLMARSYETNSISYIDWVGLLSFASLSFSATYTTTTNSYGATIIDEVRDIHAYGNTSSTTVDVRDYDYTLIDGRRTIATNYSCQVGVQKTNSDGSTSFSYYTREYYVEFYASGGANVYD